MKADDKVIKALYTIVEIIEYLNIEYIVFGSCGIQSYMPCFFRIPNDLDLVLREKDMELFLNECIIRKFTIVEESGRYKIYVDKFPIHIIPEIFSIINKEDSSVFEKINLALSFNNASRNTCNFLYSENKIIVNVMPLEYILFMELDRKQDTNTFYSIVSLLSLVELPIERINLLINDHAKLKSRIAKSIFWLRERLESTESISYLNNSIRVEALHKLDHFNHIIMTPQ